MKTEAQEHAVRDCPIEQKFLGACLNDPDLVDLHRDLPPGAFSIDKLGEAWRLLLRLHQGSRTLEDLEAALVANGVAPPFGKVGWRAELSHCQDEGARMGRAQAIEYRNRILKAARGRDIRKALIEGATLLDSNGDDPEKALREQIRKLQEIEQETARVTFGAEFLKTSRTLCEITEDDTPEPPSVLGDGLIRARQIAHIHGDDGSRKGWAIGHLLIAEATGTDWFDIPTRPGGIRCGLISLEDDVWELKRRLNVIAKATGIDPEEADRNIRIICPPHFDKSLDILDPAHQEGVKDWIRSHGLELVAIDHLSRVHTLDSELELHRVSRAGIEIARETNSVPFFSHHNRKPPPGASRRDSAASRGDSRFKADCRLNIAIEEIADRIRLTIEKATGGRKPPPIWLKQREDGALEKADPPKKPKEQAAERRALMVEAIEETGEKGITPGELATILPDVTPRTIATYARELRDKRTIEITGRANQTRYKVRKATDLPDLLPDLS